MESPELAAAVIGAQIAQAELAQVEAESQAEVVEAQAAATIEALENVPTADDAEETEDDEWRVLNERIASLESQRETMAAQMTQQTESLSLMNQAIATMAEAVASLTRPPLVVVEPIAEPIAEPANVAEVAPEEVATEAAKVSEPEPAKRHRRKI